MSLQALVWYFHGRQAEATRLCEEALAESAGRAAFARRSCCAAPTCTAQVDMARSVREIEEAVGILESEAHVDPDLMAEALLDRASGRLQMAHGALADDVEPGDALHAASGRSWEWDRSGVILYELARHTDDLETALARLTAYIQHRADRGAENPFWFVHAALINSWLGDWSSAREWADRAIEAYAREGADLWPAFALRGLALVDALEGRVEEHASSRRAVSSSHPRAGTSWWRSCTGASSGSSRSPSRTSRRLIGSCALRRSSIGSWAWSTPCARASQATSWRPRSAWATSLARSAPSSGWSTPDAPRRRRGRLPSALAAGGCSTQRAAIWTPRPQALERSLDEHRRLPMPFERARTLLVKGRVHHRRKEKRLAADAFAAALRVFEELGSPLWAEQARTELARAGLRRREPDELNETERRVAELAAQGLSNQEIAQRAFLSVKTVEANLTRVYRKLGIRSRAGLARRLS